MKKKIIAIILSLIIILIAFIPLFIIFTFTPNINEVKIVSIKGEKNKLIIEALAKVKNNHFLSIKVENSDIKLKFEDKEFGEAKVSKIVEINSGEEKFVPIIVEIKNENKDVFESIFEKVFSEGSATIKYEGSVFVSTIIGIWIGISGETVFKQISFSNLIQSIKIDKNYAIVKINNLLNSSFNINKLNGSLFIENKKIFIFNSTQSLFLNPKETSLLKLNVNSIKDTEEVISEVINKKFKLKSEINVYLSFQDFPLNLKLNFEKNIIVPKNLTFKLIRIEYLKFPDRLEISGIISNLKIDDFLIEGIPVYDGEGELYLNEVKVGEFKIIEPLFKNGTINRLIVFPEKNNFFKVVKNFLSNKSLDLKLTNIFDLKINLFNLSFDANFPSYYVNFDWFGSGILIDAKPFSIAYDDVSNTLDIEFVFNFTTIKVLSLPAKIEKIILELNFGNLTKFNQTIIKTINLENRTGFIAKVKLQINDPKIKPLIDKFSKEGFLLSEIERLWLTINVYGRTFSSKSELNFKLRITPLDIIITKAYLKNILSRNGLFDILMNITIGTKLKVQNLFLNDFNITILTVEGDTVVKSFYQEVNKFLIGEEVLNFEISSTIKISKDLISKIITDFFEKGKTEMIILNANVSLSIKTFSINLSIKNITLEVILTPSIYVYISSIEILNPGNAANISFSLSLHGIRVPIKIEKLNASLEDIKGIKIGRLSFKNLIFKENFLEGEGKISIEGNDLRGISKIFFGYNSTLIGKNIYSEILISEVKYFIKTEKSLLIVLIPLFKSLKINATVDYFVAIKPGNLFRVIVSLEINKNNLNIFPYNASFIIYDEIGIEIGNGNVNSFELIGGKFVGRAEVSISTFSLLERLASKIASGKSIKLYAGNITGYVKSFNFIYNVEIPDKVEVRVSHESLRIDLLEFKITKITGNEVIAFIDVRIFNPFAFGLNLTIVQFIIYDDYDDKEIGQGIVTNLHIEAYSEKILRNIEVEIPTTSISYITRHYDPLTDTIEMQVYSFVRSNIQIYSVNFFVEFYTDIIQVSYIS